MPREKPAHPSLYHYRTQKCRCQECRFINTEKRRQERKLVKDCLLEGDAGVAARDSRNPITNPLDEETLMRLRRAVGLI